MRAATLALILVACYRAPLVDDVAPVASLGRAATTALNSALSSPDGCRSPAVLGDRSVLSDSVPRFLGARQRLRTPPRFRIESDDARVIMCFVISEDGRFEPEHFVVAESSHPDYTAVVHEYLRTAIFDPAIRGGAPVRAWARQSFEFRHGGAPPIPGLVISLRPPPGEVADSAYLNAFIGAIAAVLPRRPDVPLAPAEVAFTIRADRAIDDVRLVRSSGAEWFDQAAIRSLRVANLPRRALGDRHAPLALTLTVAASTPPPR